MLLLSLFRRVPGTLASPSCCPFSRLQFATRCLGTLHVQLEPLENDSDGIFQVSLTRPEARNAIGKQFLRELIEALNNVTREQTTRCLIVKSAVDGVFCAGADLKERASMTQQETSEFVTSLRAAFKQLEDLPMPTVAFVDGYAFGGGAELALACDIRVGGPNAVFAFPETRLGIIPGAGGTQRLPRIVGRTRAKELIFTGRRVPVGEALDVGLLDHGCDTSEEGYNRTLSLAQDIAKGGPIALRMAKLAVNTGMEVDLATGLRIEESAYAQVIPTADRLEGLKAFAEKRSPHFTGR